MKNFFSGMLKVDLTVKIRRMSTLNLILSTDITNENGSLKIMLHFCNAGISCPLKKY
jgi:hypothetical protein